VRGKHTAKPAIQKAILVRIPSLQPRGWPQRTSFQGRFEKDAAGSLLKAKKKPAD